MPKIINLGELLPEDFLIEVAPGTQFTLPGDPPLELILKIAELFERTENLGTTEEEYGLEVLRELDAEMLRLLQMRDSSIEHSPFGVIGVQHVVATLLRAYNFEAVVDEPEDPEADPTKASRSRSGNGSRSSSKSSASSRTIGAK